ncbi:hypothetical protein [Flavobacterium columnare]|uniref:Uncharacterized protein n=1 Tax=Flavobacterium columnare (strain ATCC 49512 / CIP 103533 / TG 44/87) TaxID=1041826 RepID=G8X9F5_FLACA|nr:hypothetical protein [Flavobacterium columnare]AEW85902.1 hypothetical protein FCOL_05385 [Flavobacterium columnare ATCC 49512]
MKKFLKYSGIFFLIVMVVNFIFIATGITKVSDPVEEDKKEIPIKEYHLLSDTDKDSEISLFANHKKYEEQYARLYYMVKDGCAKLVKYPETLEFLSYNDEWVSKEDFVLTKKNFFINDLKKGLIDIVVDFRSENNFSQKTRNKLILTIKFKQEKDFDLVKTKIE